jgi:hypothetical protein
VIAHHLHVGVVADDGHVGLGQGGTPYPVEPAGVSVEVQIS